MEIIFTSFHAFFNEDFRLKGQTSIWMFPIYGLVALIHPMHHQMEDKPALYRGSVYTLGIFTCEYISGSLLKNIICVPGTITMPKQMSMVSSVWIMHRFG